VKKNCIFFLMLFVLVPFHSFSTTKGSNSAVSVENFFQFPAAGSDNELLAFGFFKNGFALEDSTTTCTFSSVYPVAGDVSVHGGILTLGTDLIFQNVTNLATSGYFQGNEHVLDLSQSVTGLPATYDTTLHDTQLFLNADLNIPGNLIIKGDCTIDGRGSRIVLSTDSHIMVRPQATLTLKNIELDGIREHSIWCDDNSGALVFDNMRWVQDENYTFSIGSFKVLNTADFTGPLTFIYDSALTSTIDSDSCWSFHDIVTLTIGRKNGFDDREPLYFEDITSVLKMENSTLNITSSGMRLERGTLFCDGEVGFDVDCTHINGSLVFGDGTVANDMKVKLCPNAAFTVVGGDIIYNVVDQDNFLSDEIDINFIHKNPGTTFHALQDIHFQHVNLELEAEATIEQSDKLLTLDNCLVECIACDYNISGTRLNYSTDALYQNDKLSMRRGSYPKLLYVYKDGNTINGLGNIGNTITLHNHLTELTLDNEGRLDGNIIMNGGKVICGNNLEFGKDAFFTGSGTVESTAHEISTLLCSNSITSTLRMESNCCVLSLKNDTKLTSPLTFSGIWGIEGNGCVLDLSQTGSIIIAHGSSVMLRNVVIEGIRESNIRCLDNTATLTVRNVVWWLDDNYSFTMGSLQVKDNFDLHGEKTFVYQSSMTSTVMRNSSFVLDKGMTFSYDILGRDDLLCFEDETAKFYLNNATLHVTRTGLKLTKGKAIIDGTVQFEAETAYDTRKDYVSGGIFFGNSTSANDFSMIIGSGSKVNIIDGIVSFRNVDATSWEMNDDSSIVEAGAGSVFDLQETLNLGSGRFLYSRRATLAKASGKDLLGSITITP